jgi:outer membrane protein OmpA-like peptidoglycan-associated protein
VDQAPCQDASQTGAPTATIHFDKGSAALSADERGTLAEAMPDVRGASGTVRILGHGDTEPDSGVGAARFDLALARAGAVADALAGFGIPAQKIAVSVACADAGTSGASAQLFTKL